MLARQAITVLDHPCWILVDTDGRPSTHDDEGYPHYDSKEDAEKGYAALFRRYPLKYCPQCGEPAKFINKQSFCDRCEWQDELVELPLLLPIEQDAPCLILTTVCGYVLDEDGAGVCHQDDVEVLTTWALGMGLAFTGDGRMVCGDLSVCVECAAVVAGLPPVQGPEPIPGQFTFGGGEVTPDGELPTVGELSPTAVADLTELAERSRHA